MPWVARASPAAPAAPSTARRCSWDAWRGASGGTGEEQRCFVEVLFLGFGLKSGSVMCFFFFFWGGAGNRDMAKDRG